MVTRPARLAALVLLTLTGCHSGGVGVLTRNDPPPLRTNNAMLISDVVDEHNANAARVSNVKSLASVTVKSNMNASGQGSLALERPRNFRFQVGSTLGRSLADVGSNPDEFWFWTSKSKERAIFVGNYGEGGFAPPELTFQPDWVIEGLGLREIPDAEARQIKVNPTRDPNLEQWVHTRIGPKGEKFIKVSYVEKSTGRIRQHDFYAANGTTKLATVIPSDYKVVRSATGESDTGDGVILPRKIQIKLLAARDQPQPVEMEIVLSDTKLNAPMTLADKEDLFTIPKMRGYEVVHLNREKAPAGTARVHQTRPAPPAGSGVGLDSPIPFGTDGASLKWSDPMPRSAEDLGDPNPAATMIGAKIPRATDSAAVRARAEWKGVTPSGFER